MSARYFYAKKQQNSLINFSKKITISIIGILTILIPDIQLPYAAKAKGGGVPGEGITYITRYSSESCPLPEVIKSDYVEILSCGLVKRTGQNKDYFIRVDGFSQLTPQIRDIKASINVSLPCGSTALVDKFTQSSIAQTSPVPPPFRLYTESIKFNDICLL